jgi:hypothetical protein
MMADRDAERAGWFRGFTVFSGERRSGWERQENSKGLSSSSNQMLKHDLPMNLTRGSGLVSARLLVHSQDIDSMKMFSPSLLFAVSTFGFALSMPLLAQPMQQSAVACMSPNRPVLRLPLPKPTPKPAGPVRLK